MSRVVIDLEPLRRFPQFRWLWLGYLICQFGTQLTRVAVTYQVFELTHSSVDVGLVSLIQLVPAIAGALVGGAIADITDRRRILLVTQVIMAASSVGLAINGGLSAPSVGVVYALSALTATFSGVDAPTRTAIMIQLVDRASIPKANALRVLLQQSALVVGPATSGLLLASVDTSGIYAIDAASFLASITAVLGLRPLNRTGGAPPRVLVAIADGFRDLRGRPAVQGAFIADLSANVFGMPNALFPAIGIDRFHGGAQAVGYLNAAPGVGALLATFLAGWTAHVRRPGRATLIATAVWGGAIAVVGWAPWLPVALVLLAVAGAADVLSAVFRGTILQLEAPDELRGRLSSIHTAVVQGGPRIGNAEAGFAASLLGITTSVVSGGLLCVAGSWVVARAMPSFSRYRMASLDEPEVEVDVVDTVGTPDVEPIPALPAEDRK